MTYNLENRPNLELLKQTECWIDAKEIEEWFEGFKKQEELRLKHAENALKKGVLSSRANRGFLRGYIQAKKEIFGE